MKIESRREHNPVKTRSEEAATVAHMLAPLEEQEGAEVASHRRRNGGAILLDTAELKLPKEIIEEDKGDGLFGLEPIVIFIFMLALVFIAFIAYLISTEPS